ncbi:MAG: gliding motility-associated C-terminal domain-containing protein [Chitinophagales bacterium]
MKNLTLITLLMSLLQLIYTPATAQINLVPNPSFEEYDSCPNTLSQLSYTKNWSNPNIASPDYYNSCNILDVGIPQNDVGFQNAKTGNAYAGIYVIGDSSIIPVIREYIQCKLILPLEAGKIYQTKFYVSLADRSGLGCNNIGAYFSDTPITSISDENFRVVPQVINTPNKSITNNENWTEVSGYFKATGGEQFITIGVFTDNQNTTWDTVQGRNPDFYEQSYYYIDDVAVYEINQIEMATAFSPNNDGQNDLYYPVYFDKKITIQQFRVYNKWGELIHDNTETKWDGKFRGEDQPQEVYMYYIFADLPLPDNPQNKIAYKKTGSFTLLR